MAAVAVLGCISGTSLAAGLVNLEPTNNVIGDEDLSKVLNGNKGWLGGAGSTWDSNKVFQSRENLEIINSNIRDVDCGFGVIAQDKILAVGNLQGGQVAQDIGLTLANKGAIFLKGGTGKTTSSDPTHPVDHSKNGGGLAVIAVNASEGFTIGGYGLSYLGYSLVSAPKIELTNRVMPLPSDYLKETYFNISSIPSLVVFQNQNHRTGGYSIESLNGLISEGIYVDTNELEFVVNGGTLTSHKDIQIHLNGEDFVQTNGKVDATETFYLSSVAGGEYLLEKGSINAKKVTLREGTIRINSNGSIVSTGKFDAENGAVVYLNNGASVESKEAWLHFTESSTLHINDNVEENDQVVKLTAPWVVKAAGKNNTYSGKLSVSSEEGVILQGKSFDLNLANDNIIEAQGYVNLISIAQDENSGSMSISGGEIETLTSSVVVHGDKNLTMTGTSIKSGFKDLSYAIKLSSGGDISLNNITVDDQFSGLQISGANISSYDGTGVAALDYAKGVNITIEDSQFNVNRAYLGHETNPGESSISISNSKFYAWGDSTGGKYDFVLTAGTGDLTLTDTYINYSDSQGGKADLIAKGGNITLINSQVMDNAYNEAGRGTLTVQLIETEDGTIKLDKSLLDDDAIVLGSGIENIILTNGSEIHLDEPNGSTTDGSGDEETEAQDQGSFVLSGNRVTISDSKITGNTGDVTLDTGSGGTIKDSIITGSNINVGVGAGGKLTVSDTDITGNEINFNNNSTSEPKDPVNIVVTDNSNITAGNETTDGKITIGSGVDMTVNNGSTMTSNKGNGALEGTGSLNIAGGNLTIGGGGVVNADSDVFIKDNGSINFSGPSTQDQDPGKLVVGGDITVGGDKTSENKPFGGSITVEDDGQGTIIVGGENISVGSGGSISVGTGGSLNVSTDENQLPTIMGPGLIVSGDTQIKVDGGTLEADQIFDQTTGSDKNVIITDNDSYVNLDNPFGEDGNLSFDVEQGSDTDSKLTIEVGELTEEQLKNFNDQINKLPSGDKVTTIVGPIGGLVSEEKTLEQWDEKIGTGNVSANGGVNISQSADTGRLQDQIGHGGGSYLMGSGSGTITITGPDASKNDTGKVTITGAQSKDEYDQGFDVIRPNDPSATTSDKFGDLSLEDKTELVLGSGSSWGGDISGSIVATVPGETADDTSKDPSLTVNGGHWNIGGDIGLGNGDLVIHDRFDGNGSKDAVVNVDGKVDTGNLTMKGDTTGLNVGENLTVKENVNLSGGTKTENSGAHVNVGGNFDVDGSLTMSGNSNVKVEKETTVGGGMTVGQGSTFTGGNLSVEGGDSNFEGTVNVGGDYTNKNHSTVVTGDTNITGKTEVGSLEVGDPDFMGTGTNGTFIANKDVTVTNDFTSNVGSVSNIGGNLTVGGKSEIGGSVTMSGEASFNGGLHLTENGFFVNASTDASTAVDGSLVLGQGSKVDAGKDFIVNTGTSIGVDGNGILNGSITADNEIDFSGANTKVTFSGEGSGTNSHHINAGTKGIAYENGGSHVFGRLDGEENGGVVTGEITIGKGGSLTMDSSMKGSDDQAYLFMNDTLTLNSGSKVLVGDMPSDANTDQSGIYLGNGSQFDLSVGDHFSSGSSLVDGGSIFVAADANITIRDWNLSTDATLKVDFDALGNVGMDIDEFINSKLDSDNVLVDFWYKDADKQMGMNRVSAGSIAGTDGKLGGVVDAVVANGSENARKQELVNEVFSKDAGFMTQDAEGNWVVSDYGNQRLKDVLGLPVAAGVFNIAYDAMSQMNNSLTNRTLEVDTTKSTSVWADVLATRNKADNLFGHSGYAADLYAGVLGTDTWLTKDTLVGAAVTLGKADGEGKGATMRIDNDADFYGLFAYASHNLADNATVSGDIGYMNVDNEIKTDVNYGGKGDTSVWTAGVRFDMKMYESKTLSVTPHVGLRYANFKMDTINQTATDDVHVLEAPFGVAVKGKVQAKGWDLTPKFDISVVPQFADKKAEVWNSGAAFKQDVLDPALVNTTFGVSGTKGNMTFGVNYRMGVGGDERQNHSFVGNVRYTF